MTGKEGAGAGANEGSDSGMSGVPAGPQERVQAEGYDSGRARGDDVPPETGRRARGDGEPETPAVGDP